MISANFSQTVKAMLSLKQSQITDYGKRGEINPSGIKVKYYTYFPSKSSKYVMINSLTIDWVPTISHLLLGSIITVTIKDKRATMIHKSSGHLYEVKQAADSTWTISIDSCLYFPISELRQGIPLMFDIDVPNKNIKSNVEIGQISFRISFMTVEHAGSSSIGTATLESTERQKIDCNAIESPIIPRNVMVQSPIHIVSVELIKRYLSGDMNITELRSVLEELSGNSHNQKMLGHLEG
ncbi:TPA_asm: P3 [Trachyspermum ammi virus 1]|uniref:P3 n=1 Tax=Trachyspermum ammi virus 1 TaxID=2793743 RepID=A0A8D9UIU3_9RHAB|nr:P3 [Trachyspermum ammi virus 1]DAF42353.1 TPA_asm: P3 [Trachyspermum ammi virus 1]